MKCIVIDSTKKEVRFEDLTSPTLDCLQKAVGGYIEVAYHPTEDNCIYVNEEGLINELPDWFSYEGAHQQFAGNGVIAGFDAETGDTSGCTLDLEEVKKNVKFMSLDELRASV